MRTGRAGDPRGSRAFTILLPSLPMYSLRSLPLHFPLTIPREPLQKREMPNSFKSSATVVPTFNLIPEFSLARQWRDTRFDNEYDFLVRPND